MTTRSQTLAKVSILINLTLLSVVAYEVHVIRQISLTGTNGQASPEQAISDATTNAGTIVSLADKENEKSPLSFKWSQLESPDYKIYIAKLRAIECPPQTICDIITADVNSLYENREAALRPGGAASFKFWETSEHKHLPHAQEMEFKKQRADLELEKQNLLLALGLDCGSTKLLPNEEADEGRRLAFLSPEQQIKVKGIEGRYPDLEEQVQKLVDEGTIGNPPPELAQLVAQANQKKAELVQLLGSDQYEQYLLSTSWTSENVRNRLTGFNPTETEFRAIFDTWRAQDEMLVGTYATGQPDPGNQQVKDAIKAILGDDRYQQYSRSWSDPEFRQVAQLAYDYQLPQDTATKLDNLQQTTESQKQQLLADTSLTDDQKTAALQTLQAQTTQAASSLLGTDAYQNYLIGHGNWIGNIAPAPAVKK